MRAFALSLAIAAAVAAAPAAAAPTKFTAPEYVMGNPNAKVTVVEYASASCPHCARFDMNVFPEFKRKYINTGKVRFVFREYLTPPEEVAAAGFLTARCAGQDRYFTVVDQIFHRLEEMYKTNQVYPILLSIAQANGLTPDEFKACIADTKEFDALQKRVQQAADVQHIDHTPTVLVNGKEVQERPGKELTIEDIDGALRPVLAQAPRGAKPAAPHRRR